MSTPEWDLQRGFSDWGMNCQHRITEGNEVVALIPSITPYALNPPVKQKSQAKRQWEYAQLIQHAPKMREMLQNLFDASRDDGIASWSTRWDDVEELLENLSE